MLRAVIGSCEFEDEKAGKKFGCHQLRLMFVNHLVQYRDTLFDEVKDDIKMQFGGFEDAETYSYKTYLLHMMKDGTWCDLVALKAIASMWAAKINVISANTFYQTKIRYDGPAQGADIAILFNGNYILGHYVSCLKTNGSHFIIGIPEEGPGYIRMTDRVERKKRGDYDWFDEGDEEMVYIPLNMYMELKKKADKYDQIKDIASQEPGEQPGLPTLDVEEAERRRRREKRKRDKEAAKAAKKKSKEGGGDDGNGDDEDDDDEDDDEDDDPQVKRRRGGVFEAEKNGQQEVPDDTTICPICKMDCNSNSRLHTHMKKFHRDTFNFFCERPDCGKGLVTKEGLKLHMLTHKKKKIKCTVPGCDSECSSRKTLKQHLRIYHPTGGQVLRPCPFAPCVKQFNTKSNLEQHKKGCRHNPNRVELKCEICGKGKFYTLNKKQEHKRDIHHWT